MLDFETIGNNIHDLRVKAGYSQDQLAELLCVTHQAVSRWERGLTAPTVDNIAELCSLFDVSFEQLLCLDRDITLDENNIFRGHSRMFVIRQITEGKCKFDIAENFEMFFPSERMLLLRSVKNGKLCANLPLLQQKLTPEERHFLNK